MGHQFGKQLEMLARQLAAKAGEAREVATRPGETGDEAVSDRVPGPGKDDRDCRGRVLRRSGRGIALGNDQVDLALDKVGGQGR